MDLGTLAGAIVDALLSNKAVIAASVLLLIYCFGILMFFLKPDEQDLLDAEALQLHETQIGRLIRLPRPAPRLERRLEARDDGRLADALVADEHQLVLAQPPTRRHRGAAIVGVLPAAVAAARGASDARRKFYEPQSG